MVTVTGYAGSISQTEGKYSSTKYYRKWNQTDNLKKSGSTIYCGVLSNNNNNTLIGSKAGTWNRPSTISLKNFGFTVPEGARITKIRVGYSHWRVKYGGTYGSFAAPTLSLLNTKYSKKGYSLPFDTNKSKSFVTDFTGQFTSSMINNANFGVKINYPANTSSNVCRIALQNVFIQITYETQEVYLNVSSSAEEVYVNEETSLALTVSSKNGSISSYTSKVEFTLPTGLTFTGKTGGVGTFTQTGQKVVWTGNFNNSKSINVTFNVKSTSTGSKLITFQETGSLASTKINLKILENNAKLTCDYIAIHEEKEEFQINFDITANEIGLPANDVTVNFPESFTVLNVESEDVLIPVGVNNSFTFSTNFTEQTNNFISFTVSCSTAGLQSFTTVFNSKTVNYQVKIKPSNLTVPYFACIRLNEEELDRLGDGKTYTITSIMKIVIDEENLSLFDPYDYNYRVGVFNAQEQTGYTSIDYLSNARWSEPVSEANSEEEISLTFDYCEGYPVIIFITGEYIEANARAVKLQYTHPVVMEKEFKQHLEEPGLFPYPLKKIASVDEYCISELNSQYTTNNVRAYKMDMSGLIVNENTVVQGVTVDFDINCDSEFSLLMKLIANNKTGQRSININETTGHASIGGQFDLWGLDFEDFLEDNLENVELEINLSNPFSHDSHIEINNLHVTFHYIEVADSVVKAWVNGKDLRYYNMFLESVTVPAGTENEVKYLNVDGTDSTLAYRSNIQKKKITIKFIVGGCDLTETSLFMERIGRLFSNERDKFNKPILNSIEFSNYPDRVWYFLIEDAIDADVEFADYEGKIELIVPAGTSYNKNITITNAYGVNSSIAKINPEIYIVANDNEITITEENSQQKFIIHGEDLSGQLLRIDCANRKVYKLTESSDVTGEYINTDITDKVDFNSDWFIVYGEYNFSCNNTANIQSVRFFERW